MMGTARGQGAPGQLKIRTSPRTGHASFVTGTQGGAIPVKPSQAGGAVRPIDFFLEHGALFGLQNAESQLRRVGSRTDAIGQIHTTYQQVHGGIPVFAGVLKVHQDRAGRFIAANGDAFSVPAKLSTQATVPAPQAEALARAQLALPAALLERSALVVVDPGWYGDPSIGPHLAYHIVLRDDSAGVREAFFIDAHSGATLDRWNMLHTARVREVHDAAGSASLPGPLARSEGDDPTGIADVNTAYDYAGDTYDYYYRAFGRDSLDDQGLPLVITVRSTALPCPNAAWQNNQMIFCSGMVSDDVMAHELTHGVTEYTADLIYQNQSGQLNESISDIFGELVDLFNGNAAFAGLPAGPPDWPSHPTGPGTDTPNALRTTCSTSGNGFADGYRWLIGEDSSVGVFRDMWDPTCYSDPDRANSPLQTCPANDSGGVHTGSGVPNHAFAIMTDGKSFNGQTVTGIGPIKAGAVWYRALTTYLTVASDFEDAYAALNQAAADLVGTDPNDPRTGLLSGDPFTASDAEQVDKALLAVEMNTEGACGASVAILDSTPPDQCGPPRTIIFADDFEGGANGWTVSNSNPPTPYDWVQTTGPLPFGRPGTAWFVADAKVGDCAGQDESAVHTLTSPPVVLPAGVNRPTVAFTHYIASEPGWDGGNVKIRVDNGSWQLLPATAFEYNAYNTTLQSAGAGNTNPLAGEPAWTGAGGEWGTSLISLDSYAGGGQTVQVRFEFGKDGCSGIDGWYVDDFEIYGCPPEPPTALDTNVGTLPDTPVTITLLADDEGQPDPPGELTFIIATLPFHGMLSETGGPSIDSVPHSLSPGQDQIVYEPEPGYEGTDTFRFKADDGGVPPEGGESGEATVTVTIGGPQFLTELFTGPADAFDLEYHALMLTPNGSPSFYDACLEPITELPTDPSGGSPPSFPFEDGSDLFLVAGGKTVSLYGQNYSTFWYGSNGYITFDTFDINDLSMTEESIAGHFNNKRISAFFDDLSPPGGTWSWKELSDRIVITWENVPEYGTTNSNTFQVELYFDGRIQIAWLGIDAQDGLVGLSPGGGVPADFLEQDLSSLRTCHQPGDFDGDGDVDQYDTDAFEACASGAGIPYPADCGEADFDTDNDVDQSDFGVFQRCLSGEDNPGDPSCAD
jgi:Zn-dependent metalloprotease